MNVRNRFAVLMNEAGEGEGGSGGSKIDEATQKLIDDAVKVAVEAATQALKTKNSDLIDRLQKRDAKLKEFEGIDPVKTKELLSQFEGDEEAKLLKDGKIDEVLNRRYKKRDADWQRKLDEQKQLADSAKAKSDKFFDGYLNDKLQTSFNGVIHPAAMKAALLEAKQLFKLDDEGNVVQFDPEGNVVLGKDGKTPFSPSEWINSESTKKESPYLYPATGNGGGTQQTTTGGKTNVDMSKLSPREKMELGRQTTQ